MLEEDEITDADDLLAMKITSEINQELTKIVIVGDFNQLPPVQEILPPENLKSVLGSAFTYYVEERGHNLPFSQLRINYRSHQKIVNYTKSLGYYKDLIASENNANTILNAKFEDLKLDWLQKILEVSQNDK